MRIAIALVAYMPKRFIGAEIYDHQLVKALQKEGHTVDVFTSNSTSESWTYDSVEVNPKVKVKYDLILTHIDARHATIRIRKVIGNVPMVGILHNTEIGTLYSLTAPWTGVIFNSTWAKDSFSYPDSNNTVLTPPAPALAKGKASSKEKPFLLFQSNTAETKGGSKLITSIAEALPSKRFKVKKGGWGRQLEATNLGNVSIEEHSPIVKADWNEVEWFLLPSNMESWSMTSAEAIANGVPVLTYDDLPGVRENLGDAAVYLPRDASADDFIKAMAKKPTAAKVKAKAMENKLRHETELKETVKWIEGLL